MKKLTNKEIVMVVVLVFVIIGVFYFQLFLKPLQTNLSNLEMQSDDVQAQIDTNMVIAADINRMQGVIDEMKSDGESHAIPFYDNSEALTIELNSILSQTTNFSLSFGEISSDDYLVLRPVSMSFKAPDYTAARAIIDELNASDNVMQISDMGITFTDNSRESSVNVTLTITYFEVQT